MGVSLANIFEVHLLDEKEARQLFRTRVGEKINNGGEVQEEMEKRLLKKCGGLPLAIVALADVIKHQELYMWEHFAIELEKPLTSQGTISGVHSHTYSILETSYKLMKSEAKKRFFLLACLFPFGSSIKVQEMMRYGIGLGLFQYVNNLTEAMELANTWVDELKSSSLLLEDDDKDCVKIHDVVRASTISLAEKGGDMFLIEAFPRWLWQDTCKKYYAISLMSGTDNSRLNGFNSDKLQILILDESKPRYEVPDSLFEGMTNLKILVLRGMTFKPNLPISIANLKRSLRTLVLEYCKLGNIGGIGELTNLLVLSLRGSRFKELPAKTMRNLCNETVGSGGLPTDHSDDDLDSGKSDVNKKDARSSIDELSDWRYMKVIEIQVEDPQKLPHDGRFVKNLDQFRVFVVNFNYSTYEPDNLIKLSSLQISPGTSELSSVNDLTVDERVGFGVGYKGVKQLLISECHSLVDCFVPTRTVLLNLEYPSLYHLDSLRTIVRHPLPHDRIENENDQVMNISNYNPETTIGAHCVHEMPLLRVLQLSGLEKHESILGVPNPLEAVELNNLKSIPTLWDVRLRETCKIQVEEKRSAKARSKRLQIFSNLRHYGRKGGALDVFFRSSVAHRGSTASDGDDKLEVEEVEGNEGGHE
ncbi:disease resistance protein At4g27190-like [Chenopodium quinoa]|uniref:disease resistance protein At4g27190-like n=1 Tax=Chenopodium quinoa TaxID=63459 RepID=UPI000B7912BA|nr:disease resistance protein At4g27190-like [Chenopodium quinoa]